MNVNSFCTCQKVVYLAIWLAVCSGRLGLFQDVGKGGLSFKGGSLQDAFGGFDGFGGPALHLALVLIVLQNTVPRGSRDGFDGFGGFGGCGGFGREGYPLNLGP